LALRIGNPCALPHLPFNFLFPVKCPERSEKGRKLYKSYQMEEKPALRIRNTRAFPCLPFDFAFAIKRPESFEECVNLYKGYQVEKVPYDRCKHEVGEFSVMFVFPELKAEYYSKE
jgi:hypothetical protein